MSVARAVSDAKAVFRPRMLHIVLFSLFGALAISPLFFWNATMLVIGAVVFAALVGSGRWYWTVVVTEKEVIGPKSKGLSKAHLPRDTVFRDNRRLPDSWEGVEYLASSVTRDRISLWGLDAQRRERLYRLVDLDDEQQPDPAQRNKDPTDVDAR